MKARAASLHLLSFRISSRVSSLLSFGWLLSFYLIWIRSSNIDMGMTTYSCSNIASCFSSTSFFSFHWSNSFHHLFIRIDWRGKRHRKWSCVDVAVNKVDGRHLRTDRCRLAHVSKLIVVDGAVDLLTVVTVGVIMKYDGGRADWSRDNQNSHQLNIGLRL